MKKGCLTAVIVALCLMGLFFASGGAVVCLLQVPTTLLLGWLTFLRKVLPHVTFDPAALAVGMFSVGLLFVATHAFLKWFSANYGVTSADGQARRKWKAGWSFVILAIFVLMFVTSIALTGIIHQVKWLRDVPMVENSWEGMRTRAKIREIVGVLEAYREKNQAFPVAVTNTALNELKVLGDVLEADAFLDEWGTPLQYCSDGKSYTVRSLGKNKILGGGSEAFDDLISCDGQMIADGRRRRR